MSQVQIRARKEERLHLFEERSVLPWRWCVPVQYIHHDPAIRFNFQASFVEFLLLQMPKGKSEGLHLRLKRRVRWKVCRINIGVPMVSKRRGLWSEPTAGNAKTTAVGYNTRQLEVHRTLSNRSLIRSSPTLLFVQMEIELPSTLSKQIPSPWSAELPLLQTRDVLAVDSSLLLVDWDIQVEVVKEVVAAYQGEFQGIGEGDLYSNSAVSNG